MNATENATQRGVNPYALGGMGGERSNAATPTPIDARANGLDGDVLDQLLKGRWQEGHRTGREDGMLQAQQAYAPIFDDGFLRGHEVGGAETGYALRAVLLPIVQRAVATLEAVRGKTGSQEIRDLVDPQITKLHEVLDREVGRDQRVAEGMAGQEPKSA